VSESLQILLVNAEQAGKAVSAQLVPFCRKQWEAGHRVHLTAQTEEEARSLQRNREYWGFVLRPISEQAQANGMGATAEGWHDFYRLMFLGYEHTSVRLPGKKRPSVRRHLKSTTKLSEKAMREYLEQVRAHAATTFGVTFPAMEEQR